MRREEHQLVMEEKKLKIELLKLKIENEKRRSVVGGNDQWNDETIYNGMMMYK